MRVTRTVHQNGLTMNNSSFCYDLLDKIYKIVESHYKEGWELDVLKICLSIEDWYELRRDEKSLMFLNQLTGYNDLKFENFKVEICSSIKKSYILVDRYRVCEFLNVEITRDEFNLWGEHKIEL